MPKKTCLVSQVVLKHVLTVVHPARMQENSFAAAVASECRPKGLDSSQAHAQGQAAMLAARGAQYKCSM